MPILPPPKVLETQDNSEDPEGEGGNIMFEVGSGNVDSTNMRFVSFKHLTIPKKVEFPSHHTMMENETKLEWWWWDSF